MISGSGRSTTFDYSSPGRRSCADRGTCLLGTSCSIVRSLSMSIAVGTLRAW